MKLVLENQFVTEIWVNGRAPIITVLDYDWGQTDPDAIRDKDGFPYTKINWWRPAWALGLSLHPPSQEAQNLQPPALQTEPVRSIR
jgi:ParB family chromosome partitioning protein